MASQPEVADSESLLKEFHQRGHDADGDDQHVPQTDREFQRQFVDVAGQPGFQFFEPGFQFLNVAGQPGFQFLEVESQLGL